MPVLNQKTGSSLSRNCHKRGVSGLARNNRIQGKGRTVTRSGLCAAKQQAAARQPNCSKTAAGRRRGWDDGLPPSFFTRNPPQDVVAVKWRFWLLLTAFAFARFIEVVPILRDRVKNSTGPVAPVSRRKKAHFPLTYRWPGL